MGAPTKAQCLDANAKGQDLRRDGKLSGAREAFRTCGNPSCPALLRDDCNKRLDELEKAQPTIIFEAKDGAGNDLISVKVTMDGVPVAERLAGAPLPIDPGEHAFTFEASGQPTLQKNLVIREGEKDRRERLTMGDTPPPLAAQPLAAIPVATAPKESSSTSSGLGAQKILAIVAAGAGVVGVGVGSVFGLMTLSKKSDAQAVCPSLCATDEGVSKWNDAKSAATVSTVAFVVGAVGLAGGAALWFTARSEASTGQSAQLGIGPGTIELKGAF
jgi:hypothetical protein